MASEDVGAEEDGRRGLQRGGDRRRRPTPGWHMVAKKEIMMGCPNSVRDLCALCA